MSWLPNTELSDGDVADALQNVLAIIDPLLDLLAKADPIGLRDRTRHLEDDDGALDWTLDAAARVLNTADVPGTASWDDMDLDARVHWWTRRIGALNNIPVAAPGLFGALVNRLPLRDLLGFANQSIVLCAIAREYGVTDNPTRVRMLAEILCQRPFPQTTSAEAVAVPQQAESRWKPIAVAKTLWRVAGVLRATGTEVAKRPQPRRIFRMLGALPLVGALATYFGEFGALSRTVKVGRRWLDANQTAEIGQHTDEIHPS